MTPRLALPLLAAGQTEKEAFHNEALARIDCLVGAAIDDGAGATPPESPMPDRLYLVGAAATGAWAGRDGQLAAFGEGGWRFVAPAGGMRFVHAATGLEWRYDGNGWIVGEMAVVRVSVAGEQVLGARRAAIAAPTGGSSVDAEARSAVTAILAALRNHGLIET